jgi:hypothetical protein
VGPRVTVVMPTFPAPIKLANVFGRSWKAHLPVSNYLTCNQQVTGAPKGESCVSAPEPAAMMTWSLGIPTTALVTDTRGGVHSS